MNTENIYDAVSGVDKKFVSAADDTDTIRLSFKRNRARKTKIIGSVVCCTVLVLAAGWISSQNWFGKTPSVTPNEATNAGAHLTDPTQTEPTETQPGNIPPAMASTQGSEDRQPTDVGEQPSAVDNGTDMPAPGGEIDPQGAVNGAVMTPDIPTSASSQNEGNGPFQREGDPPIQYRTLVESYGEAKSVKYPWIGPGDHLISKALGDAITEYGNNNVTYRLRLTVCYEPLSKMTPDEQRAFYQAEADRFGLSDKVVFIIESFKDDHTGEEAVTFSAHLYDPSFLDTFPDNPDFGYLIELFGEESCVK